MLGTTRHVHFVGIGGIGMSGIAELLANLGYTVTGSDVSRTELTARLRERVGISVLEGHQASHVGDADVVVVSSAVRPGNPEVAEARARGIPVIPRAEMLAELMRLRFSIAVAGSHGKTTTTSMVALVLERSGLDPTAVIGGRLSAFGSNARLGRGHYMVAEADESDRSFLLLWPSIAVMTNIDDEHLETYGGLEPLQQAFVDFGNKVPFYGAVVACADDPHLAPVLPRIRRRVVTYGFDAGARIGGASVELGSFGGRCQVVLRHRERTDALGTLELSVPGRHNLLNALAVVDGRRCRRLRREPARVRVDLERQVAALCGEELHGPGAALLDRRSRRRGRRAGAELPGRRHAG
jgi:UDP-N-acetylmuramate--alanine ligase